MDSSVLATVSVATGALISAAVSLWVEARDRGTRRPSLSALRWSAKNARAMDSSVQASDWLGRYGSRGNDLPVFQEVFEAQVIAGKALREAAESGRFDAANLERTLLAIRKNVDLLVTDRSLAELSDRAARELGEDQYVLLKFWSKKLDLDVDALEALRETVQGASTRGSTSEGGAGPGHDEA